LPTRVNRTISISGYAETDWQKNFALFYTDPALMERLRSATCAWFKDSQP